MERNEVWKQLLNIRHSCTGCPNAQGSQHRLAVTMVSFVHLCWAAIIFSNQGIPSTTTLAPFKEWFVFPCGAITFLLAAFSASLSFRTSVRNWLGVLALLPQQAILVISSVSAINSIILSRYPDGVVRAWQFIAVDQVYVIVLAAWYSVTLVRSRRWRS